MSNDIYYNLLIIQNNPFNICKIIETYVYFQYKLNTNFPMSQSILNN